MSALSFKYKKSCRIPYRGCYFDSLAELKYAISIEADFRYLREPVIIGYDPKSLTTTNYFREQTRMYTPDFLVRNKQTGEVTLVDIKPAKYRLTSLPARYEKIAENYIAQNKLPWTFRIVYDDTIELNEELKPKFNLFVKNRNSFQSYFHFHQLDRKYNADNIKYFSNVPLFPEDSLSRADYARFVRTGL